LSLLPWGDLGMDLSVVRGLKSPRVTAREDHDSTKDDDNRNRVHQEGVQNCDSVYHHNTFYLVHPIG
jgi:hypothetical protein